MRSQFSIESVQMHAMSSMVAEEKLGKEFFRQEMFLKGKDVLFAIFLKSRWFRNHRSNVHSGKPIISVPKL